MTIRESVESPQSTKVSSPAPQRSGPRHSKRLIQAKWLLAPLLGLSLVLHGLLLLVPVPSRPVPEVEEEVKPEEEEVVDLLSISSLADAEPAPPPEAETPAAAAPLAASSPPAAPQAPTQPVVPEQYPETPLPETTPETPLVAESPSDLRDGFEESPPVAGFDPNRQAQLVNSALGVLGREPGSSNFDLTAQFPGDIWDLYISQWAAATRQCFFGSIDRGGYTLQPPAADLRYLSRNIQLVERQDIPRTFAGQTVQSLGQAHCGFDLFEVQDGGIPILWVSLVPISPGGSTTMVIFWQADPRG